jgi:hypothetical protein
MVKAAWLVRYSGPTPSDTGQCAERISGQTASFTGFQKKKPGQLRADRAARIRNCGIGVIRRPDAARFLRACW